MFFTCSTMCIFLKRRPGDWARVGSILHLSYKLQVMYTDSPIVVSAPTGSGKTVLFELAIVRLLMQIGEQMSSAKIVYGMTLSLFRTIV